MNNKIKKSYISKINGISIIMPTYNASTFITKSIESILNQTFKHFEFIIIDDGSTDNTLKIINKYAKRDTRIKVIKSKHIGISKALNKGIAESKYPWIARMDADDIALPKRLEKQINATKINPKVVAWGAYAYHINSKENILSIARTGPISEKKFYEQRNSGQTILVIHPTAFLKKEILLKAGGYDSRFDGAEDIELFDRMAEYGPILAIQKPLLLYRISLQSFFMKKFFLSNLICKYVNARHGARLKGKKLSYKGFLKEYKQQPLFSRCNRYFRILGQFYFRKGSVFFAEKHYLQSCFYLSLSIFLNPKYSLLRAWNRKFSPDAHKWLKKMK